MTEITFLGTSHAIPTKFKNQTAILVRHGAENILVDCGEGTQRQFKISGLNLCKITKILITHWHGDHILGLPGVLQTLALNNYQEVLQIYGPKGTKEYIKAMLDMFIFKEKIKVEVHEIGNEIFFENNEIGLEAFKMVHGAPCLAYAFIEKEKYNLNIDKLKKVGLEPGPILKELKEKGKIKFKGKIINLEDYAKSVPQKKIAFILDTMINENCLEAAKDSDILVSEACFLKSEERLAFERKHLTAEQAGAIAKKAEAKKLILIHISQRYSIKEKEVLEEVKKIFKDVEIAKDFMKVEL